MALNGNPAYWSNAIQNADITEFERVFEQYTAEDGRGVLVLDTQRNVLRINSAGRDLLAFTKRVPAPLGDVIRDVEVGFALGDAVHDRRTSERESFLTDPDRVLRITIIPVRTGAGIVDRVLMTVEDVTRLRHLETVRRDFVANVSHELRTPLASINLLVETLQSAGATEDESRHFLRRIAVETQAMNQLVEELLQLSRMESGRLSLNLEAAPIREIMETVRNRLVMIADEKDLRLTTDAQMGIPPVMVDIAAIEQVLMNLTHNAIKFTPAGGTVTLRARLKHPGVEVDVLDTGIGMDSSEVTRIFERFYKVDKGRNRDGSSGLGLAISRHLLDLQGSRLNVVSEAGRGSRFTFGLPLASS